MDQGRWTIVPPELEGNAGRFEPALEPQEPVQQGTEELLRMAMIDLPWGEQRQGEHLDDYCFRTQFTKEECLLWLGSQH